MSYAPRVPETYYLMSDETHYWIQHEYSYGREGCVSETKLGRVPKTLDKKELIKQLSQTYHHSVKPYDYSYYQEQLAIWEKDRKLVEHCSGDLEFYDKYYSKPQKPIVPKSFLEFVTRRIDLE